MHKAEHMAGQEMGIDCQADKSKGETGEGNEQAGRHEGGDRDIQGDEDAAKEGIASQNDDGSTNTHDETGGEQTTRLMRETDSNSGTNVQSPKGTDSAYPSGPG